MLGVFAVKLGIFEESLVDNVLDVYLPQRLSGAEVTKAVARAALGEQPGPRSIQEHLFSLLSKCTFSKRKLNMSNPH